MPVIYWAKDCFVVVDCKVMTNSEICNYHYIPPVPGEDGNLTVSLRFFESFSSGHFYSFSLVQRIMEETFRPFNCFVLDDEKTSLPSWRGRVSCPHLVDSSIVGRRSVGILEYLIFNLKEWS